MYPFIVYYCVCICVFLLFALPCFSFVAFPSVLWYCWSGLLTCKNRLPYKLYYVGRDVKHCSTNHRMHCKKRVVGNTKSQMVMTYCCNLVVIELMATTDWCHMVVAVNDHERLCTCCYWNNGHHRLVWSCGFFSRVRADSGRVCHLNGSSATGHEATSAVPAWYQRSDAAGSDGKLHHWRHSKATCRLLTGRLYHFFLLTLWHGILVGWDCRRGLWPSGRCPLVTPYYTVSPQKHVTTFSTITLTISVRLQ